MITKKDRVKKNIFRRNKNGFTLIELVAAIAIAAIVGTMTATMFMFPMRMLGNGEDLSDVQFNLRMTSDIITNEVRLATGVEILPASFSVPTTIANDDKYIFVNSSQGTLVVRDKTGDHVQFRADNFELLFITDSPFKTLSYSISGQNGEKAFSLNSQVTALNLESGQTVKDSSGTGDGTIIKIENNLPSVGTTGLYFVMASPFEATVNEPFFRSLTPFNYTGSYSYALINGELPAGVGLNSSGSLAGTPTSVGSYIFSIRLTDASTSVVRTFLVNIVPAAASDPAPVASDVAVAGIFQKGNDLTGTYVYTDMHSVPQPEGASIVTWYRMDDMIGTNKSVITSISPSSAVTPTTYTIAPADVGKYVAMEVTPKTSDGRIGNPVLSTPQLVSDNLAPEALDVGISPAHPGAGSILQGSYTYYDKENDDEWFTTFQWYYSSGPSSTKLLIEGATGITYVTKNTDKNNYFYFEVTPRAVTGEKIGISIMSANVKVGN